MALTTRESGLVQSAPASDVTNETILSDSVGGENSYPELVATIDPESPVNVRTIVKEADYGAGNKPAAADPQLNPIEAAPPTGAGAYAVGDNVTLVANFTNYSSAQWQLDLVDIVGATDAVLKLPNIQLLDAGSYTCDFDNLKPGSNTSTAIVVTVT